jgi:transposase-like protein
MHTSAPNHPYKYHRFPAEIISHGVWLYYRFCLSYRDVEELLFARGVIVTYEAIRTALATTSFTLVGSELDLVRETLP